MRRTTFERRRNPMIKGLSTAGIWSEDIQKKLLPFYRDVLGLQVTVDTPEFVVFGAPNGPAVTLGTHSDVHGENKDPARHMVGLATDDIYGDVERLKKQGVKFVEPEPEKFDQVTVATFLDPEGNYVQLLQFAS
jgi:predicted enzyme related to lactoylglutathione lyase